MAKRIKKRNKKTLSDKLPATRNKQEPEPEKPFDFGGLPNRDLKKNLGCG